MLRPRFTPVVVHQLAAHRVACLSLYKRILKHITALPLEVHHYLAVNHEQPQSLQLIRPIFHQQFEKRVRRYKTQYLAINHEQQPQSARLIRQKLYQQVEKEFRRYQTEQSLGKIRSALTSGYEAESQFRQAVYNNDASSLQKILAHIQLTPVKGPKPLKRHAPPVHNHPVPKKQRPMRVTRRRPRFACTNSIPFLRFRRRQPLHLTMRIKRTIQARGRQIGRLEVLRDYQYFAEGEDAFDREVGHYLRDAGVDTIQGRYPTEGTWLHEAKIAFKALRDNMVMQSVRAFEKAAMYMKYVETERKKEKAEMIAAKLEKRRKVRAQKRAVHLANTTTSESRKS